MLFSSPETTSAKKKKKEIKKERRMEQLFLNPFGCNIGFLDRCIYQKSKIQTLVLFYSPEITRAKKKKEEEGWNKCF
jgi:hypothetical protein